MTTKHQTYTPGTDVGRSRLLSPKITYIYNTYKQNIYKIPLHDQESLKTYFK